MGNKISSQMDTTNNSNKCQNKEQHKSDDSLMKIVIVGDSGVGKSCLLLRFTKDTFIPNLIGTIGLTYEIKTVQLDGKKIKLLIWDSSGPERYRTITTSYYRGSNGIMLVYDVTDNTSISTVRDWMIGIKQFASENVQIMLVGHKKGTKFLDSDRVITKKQGQQLADKYNILFIEANAATNENVQIAFEYLAWNILKNQDNSNSHSNNRVTRWNSYTECKQRMRKHDEIETKTHEACRINQRRLKLKKHVEQDEIAFPSKKYISQAKVIKTSRNQRKANISPYQKINKHTSKLINPKEKYIRQAKVIKTARDQRKTNCSTYTASVQDAFTINIFHQNQFITLNQKVAKETKIQYIKELFKKQTDVFSLLGDIHFYSKGIELTAEKTLQQCNIIDDKNLITVKVAADGTSSLKIYV